MQKALRLTVFRHSMFRIYLGEGADDWGVYRLGFYCDSDNAKLPGLAALPSRPKRYRPNSKLSKGNRTSRLVNRTVPPNGEWRRKFAKHLESYAKVSSIGDKIPLHAHGTNTARLGLTNATIVEK